jgi:hypothetical protein
MTDRRKTMKPLLSVIVAGILLVSVGAPAAAQESTADDAFAILDLNGDGKLSESEFAPLVDPKASDDQKQQEFAIWDANGDKSISKDEFAARYSTREKPPAGQEKKR